ncbi:MAG: alpha/beta hydrolase [Chloroflexota bacterium]|nr:alpha/beta hydrolase [Chloroflexota bacterium]
MPRPEEIRFLAGRETLAGELLLPEMPTSPDRRGRYPWAVLLPSWLPRDRDGRFDAAAHPDWFASEPMAPLRAGLLRRLALALAERGVASFRYDSRGCGISEGNWPSSDLFTRIDDARDAIGAMRSRPELDLARTGIVGHGEGAVIGLSVAIADPAVGALTLIGAPARSLRDLLRRGAAERGRSGTDQQHPLVAALDRNSEELIERAERREAGMELQLAGDPETVTLNLSGWEQGFHTPAIALATMLHRSLGLVHGERDAWSHPDESRLLRSALPDEAERPAVRLVPGAGHDLAEAPDALIGELAADLAARLLPRQLPPVLLALEELG